MPLFVCNSRNNQTAAAPAQNNGATQNQEGTSVRQGGGPPSGSSNPSSNSENDRGGNNNSNRPYPPVLWYEPSRGNGGGGGGGNRGDGDQGNPILQDPNCSLWWRVPEEWQLNHKSNTSVLPKWDGAGETAIDYLSRMGFLAGLRSKMKEGITQLAPIKWTSYA